MYCVELDLGKMLNHMVIQASTFGRTELNVSLEESMLILENGPGKFHWAQNLLVRSYSIYSNVC